MMGGFQFTTSNGIAIVYQNLLPIDISTSVSSIVIPVTSKPGDRFLLSTGFTPDDSDNFHFDVILYGTPIISDLIVANYGYGCFMNFDILITDFISVGFLNQFGSTGAAWEVVSVGSAAYGSTASFDLTLNFYCDASPALGQIIGLTLYKISA